MADLKLNEITPDGVGKIKLGSTDVQKIYSNGTRVWPTVGPGEVEICNLIWTNTNYTETELTAGGNLPILTNQTDWYNALQAQTPAACYWNFDSNNASYGLLYNYFAKNTIKPITGFRLPTTTDWTSLNNAPCYTNTGGDFNRYGANPGVWDPSKLTNTNELGDSGLGVQGYGYGIAAGVNLNFLQPTLYEGYWADNANLDPAGYGYFVNENNNLLNTVSFGDNTAYALFIRFVKNV
jgi:uncharacterized protein (TIGR02145 family)